MKKCGRRLYDDFEEIKPGALNKLETLLASYFSEPSTTLEPADLDDQAPDANPSRNSIVRGLVHRWKQLFANRQKDMGLPWSCCPVDAMELEHYTAEAANARLEHNFVLLCLPFMRWAKKLQQLDTCALQSDQTFFLLLRRHWTDLCKSRPWTSSESLRRVVSLDFVKVSNTVGALQYILLQFRRMANSLPLQFEMYRNELVDVHDSPSVPDREDKDQARQNYIYHPLPAETNPPIGPNLLMHLFQHPEHADVEPTILRKIPKKLRTRLEACPVKGSAVGWGLQFTEGVNWVALFVYGCGGFVCALVFAVAWSLARGDIQSGFAIGSFLVAFVGFCLGIARTEIQLGT